ncbi:protocadherin gamma subfamily A, 3 L homeolog isoform X37 [Xenopus laevis]|uniref:Protocadherin gamma-C3 n=1 Tax=Xenopus laevis TaxID=8355 RepID=A0A8J1MIG5_XENLA|nr:protocadherin gamma subfamily A, 3 L homeolog isoform X37 [Xenopus laevis]
MAKKIKYRATKKTIRWQVMFFVFPFLCESVFCQLQYSTFEEQKLGFIIGNIANDLGVSAEELSSRKFHVVSRSKKQYLNVHLETGDLYVADRIDREALCGMQQNCFLNIEAVMENPLHFYTINVEIQDVNDNSPSFSKSIFEIGISESAVIGAHFALGSAKDPDLGNNSVQSYKLGANEHFGLLEKVNMDGKKYPELVLEKPLDREKNNSSVLILSAFDGGTPLKTGTSLIKIVVTDVNDNYPLFNKDTYRVTLSENAPVGFLVTELHATDADEGSNAQITYLFHDIPENAHEIFSINPLNGSVKIIGKLDYEVATSYEMTVEVKDGGGLVSYCKLLIQVSDVNDNAPDILITFFLDTIPEDSPVGTVIALVNLDDLDSGENGEVVGQISESLPFHLISSSGNYYKLVTSMDLDREKTSEYNITIKAEDKGSPQLTNSKTIRLILTDVNDNDPVFDKTNYIAYIQENNPSGNSFYKVHATDLDINENGKVVYMILIDNIEDIPISSYVSINTVTGVVYAQRSFDYEKLREFNIQVMAKDSGSPSRSANATVKICITDQNDNAPKILYPSQESEAASVYEFIPHFSTKGYLVTKVVAVDADSGHNAWLSYHLLQVLDPSFLIIGQDTGEIRTTRDLQETDARRQKVVVMVKDNGYPIMSSTVTLHLVVAENFQQVVPEVINHHIESDTQSKATFYLVISIALISILFIFTVILAVISKCRKQSSPTALSRDLYPQVALRCPSVFSDGTLPFPYTYDVCVTLDSRQNEVAYLKPVQNVPTDNLIDTDDSVSTNDLPKDNLISASTVQAQPNADWRFSQAAQKPGPSGTQPTEEAGVWPNNQFETERLQAMILASANEAAEGTSGLGGGTGTMGLSARYGPQFTLQHVPDYRQNVYIPGSTLTPTNGGGKREGKGNKKKSSKKDKK